MKIKHNLYVQKGLLNVSVFDSCDRVDFSNQCFSHSFYYNKNLL